MKQKSDIILGMIMLEDNNSINTSDFIEDYNDGYNYTVQKAEGDSDGFACTINDETVIIAQLEFPIPVGDIEGTAKYAYNWPTVLDDVKDHKDHLIVSIMNGSNDPIKRFKIFTQVIASLLKTTNAIGVYKGNQSLLIAKAHYLQQAGLMSDEYLPLNIWIYFGLRKTKDGNNGYTYGLSAFNKTEMEIIHSSKSLKDIRAFLFNIAHYVLDCDITFKAGETCGLSADEKIPITHSKGHFVDGDTFKLGY